MPNRRVAKKKTATIPMTTKPQQFKLLLTRKRRPLPRNQLLQLKKKNLMTIQMNQIAMTSRPKRSQFKRNRPKRNSHNKTSSKQTKRTTTIHLERATSVRVTTAMMELHKTSSAKVVTVAVKLKATEAQ